MKYIIDRFEDNFAVCEDENQNFVDVEKAKLPKDAREGDIIIVNGDKITVDKESTKARKKEVQDLFDSLF